MNIPTKLQIWEEVKPEVEKYLSGYYQIELKVDADEEIKVKEEILNVKFNNQFEYLIYIDYSIQDKNLVSVFMLGGKSNLGNIDHSILFDPITKKVEFLIKRNNYENTDYFEYKDESIFKDLASSNYRNLCIKMLKEEMSAI